MVRSAVYGYLKYGIESAFQTEQSSKTRVFGLEQKVSGLQFLVNRLNLSQLYSPELSAFAFGRNEGKMSIEFILSNPWFLDLIFETPQKTGSSPYTWTWDSSTSANPNVRALNSASIDVGFQGEQSSGVNLTRTPLGVIATQVAIRTTMNDTIRCTTDLIWGKENTIGTNSYVTNPPTDDIAFPYTFVHGTIQTNEGTVIAQVQDVDLTLNNNAELLWGLGSANAASNFRKVLDMTGRFNCALIDAQHWNDVVGRAEISNFTLKFTNGLSSTNERSITFTGSGVGYNDHNTNLTPVDPVFQELNFAIRNMKITAVNNSSAEP